MSHPITWDDGPYRPDDIEPAGWEWTLLDEYERWLADPAEQAEYLQWLKEHDNAGNG